MNKLKLISLGGLLIANAALAAAQAQAQELPPMQSAGPVSYTSGGIGSDEAKAFQQAAPRYPLEMEFVVHAQPRDVYTSDVQVQIADAKGNTILDTVSEGPFMLAQLPGGRYVISVTDKGKTVVRDVDITPGQHRRVVFAWSA
jgi:hypothetical protein